MKTKKKNFEIFTSIKLLWQIATLKNKVFIVVLLLGCFIRAISSIIVPLITAAIIAKLSGTPAGILGIYFPDDWSTFKLIIICFAITFAIYMIASIIRAGIKYFACQMRINTNIKAINYLLEHRKNFDLNMTNGEASYIIKTACDNVASFIEVGLVNVIVPVITTIYSIVYVACVNLYCLLILLATIVILISIIVFRTHRDKLVFRKLETINGNINNHTLNIIDNLPLIGFFKSKAKEIQKTTELNNSFFKTDKKRLQTYLIYYSLVYLVEFACTIAIPAIILSGSLSTAEQISILIIIIPYILKVFTEIENLSYFLGDCQQKATAISRLLLIKVEPQNLLSFNEQDNPKVNSIDKINVQGLKYNIGNFSKKYSNITFYKGQINCIAGESGGGKTSLINAILGLKEYSEGTILINDEIKVKSLFYYSDKIALAVQSEKFFDRSIEENIVYPNNEINEKALSFIKKFEIAYLLNKTQDVNKDFKSKLSGGEKKRINIIRCISKDADVYILDEPTNELDKNNVKRVIKELKKLKKHSIVIVISHDKNILDISENIILV